MSFLKHIGKALLPQAKGKGKKGRAVIGKDFVALYYYKMLFRVTRTAELLKQPGKAAGERIKFASEQYGLTVADIKKFGISTMTTPRYAAPSH